MRSLIFFLVILLISLLNPIEAWTAEISKVKGKQVLIVDYDGGGAGEEYYALDGNGKKKALIEIKKAKNGRAVGEITKGRAEVGYTLQSRSTSTVNLENELRKPRKKKPKTAFGGIAGFTMDSMSVPVRSSTESMKGTGFAFKGAIDYGFSTNVGIRFMGGYESFSVKNATYRTEISYITLEVLGRYLMNPDSVFGLWIGAGMGFAIPFSKSTNVLQEDSIATSTLLYLAAGVDFKVSKNLYFPIQVDYAIFLPASDVKTNILGSRAGIMLLF